MSGGDDYELIFSINPKNIKKIEAISKKLKLKLTCIGKFFKESNYQTNKNSSVFLFPDQQNNSSKNLIKISKKGYEHQ